MRWVNAMLGNRCDLGKAVLSRNAGNLAAAFRAAVSEVVRYRTLAALVISGVTFCGCAFAPGMSFNSGSGGRASMAAQAAAASRTVHGTVSSPGAGSSSAVGDDVPPAGSMIEINADLIDKLRAAKEPGIPKKVRHLFAKPRPYTPGPGHVLS